MRRQVTLEFFFSISDFDERVLSLLLSPISFLFFLHCIDNVDWLIQFFSVYFPFYLLIAAMESTESYAAGSPEELAKRSPEPHDSSEAGIFDPIWSFVFFRRCIFLSTLTQMFRYFVTFVNWISFKYLVI